MFYTYILYSPSLDRLYRGSTQDLPERIRRHNAGIETATTTGTPWVLLWATAKSDRSDAVKLEYRLKNLSRKRILAFVHKYQQDINPDEKELLRELYRREWPDEPVDLETRRTQDFHS